MGPLCSRSAQYAIRALTHLAALPPGANCVVKEIAAAEEIPAPFLSKILHGLARAGLIESQKGPHGGVALARPREAIDLLQVIEAVDGPMLLEGCVLGLRNCGGENPCVFHEDWSSLKVEIAGQLRSRTLADLALRVGPGPAEARMDSEEGRGRS